MQNEDRSDKSILGASQNIDSAESVSNLELLHRIDEMMDAPNAEKNLNTDKLIEYLAKLEKCAPMEGTYTAGEVWKGIKDSHPGLFQDEAVKILPTQTKNEFASAISNPDSEKHSHPLRKRLSLIAAVLALAFVLMVPARAAVFEFLDFIARSTAEIFRFDRSDAVYAKIETYPIAEGEEATYASLQDALDALGIVAPLAPKGIPERFGAPIVTVTNTSRGVFIFSNYIMGTEFLSIQFKESDGRDLGAVETNGVDSSTYQQGGIQHFILADKGVTKVTWQNGELECCISGTLSQQEMKDFINSIYEE